MSVAGRPQSLPAAAAKGVRVALRLDEPATVEVRVLLARAAARRLGLAAWARKPIVVGRVTRPAAAGAGTLRVRLTRRARLALAHARRVTVIVTVRVRDAAGNTATRTAQVALRR